MHCHHYPSNNAFNGGPQASLMIETRKKNGPLPVGKLNDQSVEAIVLAESSVLAPNYFSP
jgi:hypothetical protein